MPAFIVGAYYICGILDCLNKRMRPDDFKYNFCESCVNKHYIEKTMVCGLVDEVPEPKENCIEYEFDDRGRLERCKEEMIQKYSDLCTNSKSKFYSILEEPCEYKPKKFKEKFVARFYVLFQIIIFIFNGGLIIGALYFLIEHFEAGVILAFIAICSFPAYAFYLYFTNPNKVELTQEGIELDKHFFVWRCIDDIFIYHECGDESSTEYIIILYKSGDHYKCDFSKIYDFKKKITFYTQHWMKKARTKST